MLIDTYAPISILIGTNIHITRAIHPININLAYKGFIPVFLKSLNIKKCTKKTGEEKMNESNKKVKNT